MDRRYGCNERTNKAAAERRRAEKALAEPKPAKPRRSQSEIMSSVNASISTQERSVIQTKTWEDPAVRAARVAGLKASAADPALRAQRLANMLAGKRRKAAERALAAAVLPIEPADEG